MKAFTDVVKESDKVSAPLPFDKHFDVLRNKLAA